VATIVAVVAGFAGFFIVLRGAASVADAVPQGAFAGAAGASLIGINTLIGVAAAALLGALGIGWLGRRGRRDVATALALVVCVAAILALYRPLLLTSVMPELAEARGIRPARVEAMFLVMLALATSMSLPVVGALLIFSLMIGPPAAARSVTSKPLPALALSAVIAVVVVWLSIAAAYQRNWPVGFFVGALGAVCHAAGRGWAALRVRRPARPAVRRGAGEHGVTAANVRV
jgi:zinc/manganese transport system permease protein